MYVGFMGLRFYLPKFMVLLDSLYLESTLLHIGKYSIGEVVATRRRMQRERDSKQSAS